MSCFFNLILIPMLTNKIVVHMNFNILMLKQPEILKSLTLSKMLMELRPKLRLTTSDFPGPRMSKQKVRDEMLRKCHNLQLLRRVRGECLARWQGT